MAVPDFQTLMLPLLKLASDGQQHTHTEAVERLAQEFQLSDDDRTQLLRSGQTRLYNRVGWTTTHLKKAGLLQAVGPGRFQLTDRGQDVLAHPPASINVAFLERRFPEYVEFRSARSPREVADEEPPAIFNAADGTWNQRARVKERVHETLELSFPNEAMRREVLRFLALAIEIADEERPNAWYVRETARGLRLMTGREYACEIAPSKTRVSVIGPIGEDIREIHWSCNRKGLGVQAVSWRPSPHVPCGAGRGSPHIAQRGAHQLRGCRDGPRARFRKSRGSYP